MPLYKDCFVCGACMSDNLLKFSASLDRDQLLTSQPKSELSCHVNIESNVIAGIENEIATTANICLLFDCSFSMSGKKFETAIKTAKMIVDILHERHWISLLAFHSRCDTVFKNQVPAENSKELIKKKIDKIHDHLGGSTNMAAGIKRAMGILEDSKADADVIVLLSDGVADSPENAQLAAEQASKRGFNFSLLALVSLTMPINFLTWSNPLAVLSLVTVKGINSIRFFTILLIVLTKFMPPKQNSTLFLMKVFISNVFTKPVRNALYIMLCRRIVITSWNFG